MVLYLVGTGLIYDIMQAAEDKELPGLLMLTDFEKAFESLSSDFCTTVFIFGGFR